MPTIVVGITNAVKLDVDNERCQSQGMATFIERVDTVLAEGKFSSEREWCDKAGISLGYIATRRSRGGGAGRSDKITALARIAGVTVEWLIGESDVRTRSAPPASAERPVIGSGSLSDPGLKEALKTYPWPADLTIEAMRIVADRLENDAREAGRSLPAEFWHMHITRTIAAVKRELRGRRTG